MEDQSSETYSTTRPLFGQTAVVTGAARGIGRAIAIALGRAGANVIVNYLQSETAAHEVVAQIRGLGSKADAVQADVRDPADVSRLFTAATQFGLPRILVNNAGVAHAQCFDETTLDDWQRLLESNLTAPFLCTKAALPYLRRSGAGRIINIASVWGLTGGAHEVAYSAAKGGLIAFTKALAKEVSATGITVNAVAPGAIDTEMLGNLDETDRAVVTAETPVGRLGRPEDVAHAVLFLASPAASFITGQVISPNGGLVT